MANSSHSKISVFSISWLLLFCVLSLMALSQVEAKPGDIIKIAPADSVFVLEIDSFEYTVSTLDQYLTGVSPVPMGIRMLIRTQLAQVLGNPELAGIDMNGTFGVFSVAPSEPPANGDSAQITSANSDLSGLLVPMTDYNQFVTSNPNCSKPDAQGVSKINTGVFTILVKQAGSYAVAIPDLIPGKAIAIADSIAATASNPPVEDMEIFAAKVASKPVRLFVDTKKAISGLSPQLQQMQQQAADMAKQQGQDVAPGMMNFDLSAMAQNLPIEYITIGLSPTANVLNASLEVAAIANSPAEAMFKPDSQELAMTLAMIQAKPPTQMGPELSGIVAMLPDAANANFVGTFNIVDTIKMAAAMSPLKAPPIEIETKSNASYAITAGNGALQIDIALPKEHLSEVVVGVMSMQKQMAEEIPSAQPQELPTPERTEPIRPQPVNTETFDSTPDTTVQASGQASVKVAGARLVRYSDMERKVLPLGRTDGYTLSLIAELPEPAVQIAGGTLERARANTGKSLLPEYSWQCKIKLARLSTDRRTAIFDVDLALPDYDVKSIDELTGNLEYLTAGADREIDLGVLAMKSGSKGQALGATITSVKEDFYGNNPTIMNLALNLPAEALKSVSINELPASIEGRTSIGDRTTYKLAVRDKLPQQARIVLKLHDNLKRSVIPFKITQISLTGQPIE